MIEQVFKLNQEEKRVVEMVLHDENLHYNHMVFPKGNGFPDHYSNSTVYMTVVRGTLEIALGDNDFVAYPKGTLLKIPNGVLMRSKNPNDEILELIVVKAPAPKK